MKKILSTLFITLFISFFALTLADAQTAGTPMANSTVASPKIEIIFFYSPTCPHCQAEELFLDKMQTEYPTLDIRRYNIFQTLNASLLADYYKKYSVPTQKQGQVPITFIGDNYLVGYIDENTTGQQIKKLIDRQINKSTQTQTDQEKMEELKNALAQQTASSTAVELGRVKIPFLGEKDIRHYSPLLLSVILGALDGFNPCAMIALMLLLSILVATGARKKVFLIGGIFIFISGLVYFLFMAAWLNLFLFLSHVKLITVAVGIATIIFGLLLLREYINNIVCKLCKIDPTKETRLSTWQRKLLTKMNYFTNTEMPLYITVAGVALIAAGINTIELFCSFGFPVAFTKTLTALNLSNSAYYFHMLVYILFYMLDDMLIFTAAIITMRIGQSSTKYLKIVKLISAIVMLLLGLGIIFQPSLLSFGF